ncbi:DMT family transporter [Rhodospirillaceae bacterium SYSU D60014]|uniref:DMT family transporter n=1 Tax=Virgifigura deserti TaxID=2268457 RepID=UPI000E666018
MTSLPNGLAASAGEAALQRRGLLLVAGAATVWSSGGLIVRGIEADPWTTILWRSIFGALFLLGFIAIRDRGRTLDLFRRMGGPGLVVALCFATASTGFVIAVNLTTVANTLIILSTSPLLAALLGRVLLGERVRARSWIAMTAAFFGIAIMVSNSFARGSAAGDLVAFVIAMAFAVAIVTTRRQREVRMTPATCLAAVFAALFALPFAAPLAVSASDMGLLVLFGAVQFGGGLVLFTAGARLAPAAEVALVSVLETILGPVWVWLFLGENPGVPALIGGVIVLAALAVHTALDLRQTRPVPPAV